MPVGRDHNSGNKAVTLLATCFVVVGGALTCGFIALSGDPEHPGAALGNAAAWTAGIVFVLWILRERPRENRAKAMWAWLTRRGKRKVSLRIGPRVPRSQAPSAPLAPPSAESIRQLTGGTSTWVPSQTRPPDRPARSDSGRPPHS